MTSFRGKEILGTRICRNRVLLFLCVFLCFCSCTSVLGQKEVTKKVWVTSTSKPTWLITGATGRTGALTYNLFSESDEFEVRGLVRNRTKAKERLHCGNCSKSQGIFVGDVTKAHTLTEAMMGSHGLVILTSAIPIGKPPFFHFPKGGKPIDVDYYGALNQIRAAANAGVKHIVLVSTLGTTKPSSSMGHISFYKLNGEAFLMGSGMPFTIIKPGGLVDREEVQNSALQVGHADTLPNPDGILITRKQVADLIINAAKMPEMSTSIRFDVTTDPRIPASKKIDYAEIFKQAKDIRKISSIIDMDTKKVEA